MEKRDDGEGVRIGGKEQELNVARLERKGRYRLSVMLHLH